MATDEEWTSGKNTLSTENVVFAQTIIGLQKQFGEAFTDLIQKIYIAIYSYTNEFNINFKNILLALNAPRGISLNFYMENMQNINSIVDGLKDLDIPKQTIINMFWPELADQVLDAQILIQQLDKETFRKQSIAYFTAFNGNLNSLDASSNTVSVIINDNKIRYTATLSSSIFTIEKGDKDSYTIKSHSLYYIGRTASTNGMNTSTSTAYTNTISITDGNATITGSNDLVLKYNKSSGQERFRYFTSGQQDIQLYKLHEGTQEVNSVDIRFKVNLTTEIKSVITLTGSSITYGYLYAKSEKTIGEMTYGASGVSAKVCTNFNADGSYSLVLTNIPSSAWNTKITVRAYVCIGENYYYSDIRVLSVKDACETYIANPGDNEAVKKALGILDYIVNYSG